MLALGTAIPPAHAAHFNRDQAADLLQRNRSETELQLRVTTLNRLAPGVVEQSRSIVLGPVRGGSPGFDVRTADFNADGRSDILSRNLSSKTLSIRLMDGVSILSQRNLELSARNDDTLIATADFDGDKRSDLLFRDTKTGTWSIDLLNGTEVRSSVSGATVVPTSSTLGWVSSEDFDGDGRADLLLRNRDTLAWQLYLMNGRTVRSTLSPGSLPRSPDWLLQTVADMNRDQHADLLFRHVNTGQWYSYFMNGAQVLPSSGPAGIYSNVNYDFEGLGDFNGDGYLDVLQRRPSTGRWYVTYLMDRFRLPESTFVAPEIPKSWRVAQIDDFTGDGVDEALVTDTASTSNSLLLAEVSNPLNPVITPLEGAVTLANGVACDPPNYYQFGTPKKPLDAAAHSIFLSWKIPVSRTNGEALCTHELDGYTLNVRARNAGTVRNLRVDGARSITNLLDSLPRDTYVFKLYALDTQHETSNPATASKTIQ